MDWKDILSSIDTSGMDPGTSDPIATQDTDSAVGAQTLTLVYERKGRKGKPATIIVGFDWPDDRIAQLLTHLQTRLGVGGSARGGEILLQGDCRERVARLLREMGHKVKGV